LHEEANSKQTDTEDPTTPEILETHRDVIENIEDATTQQLLDARREIAWRETELNFFPEAREGNLKNIKWKKLDAKRKVLEFDRGSIEEELCERMSNQEREES